ncbi:unnamed protein product [Prunus armeniaca]
MEELLGSNGWLLVGKGRGKGTNIQQYLFAPPPMLAALSSELPSASMARVRNSLEALCGQEQAELRGGINPTL